MNVKSLEEYEAEYISKLRRTLPPDVIITTGCLEDLAENMDVARKRIIFRISPTKINNYAITQREADRINKESGKELWIGCSCGHIHYAELGHAGSSWY